ncbi:MAG: FdtA/QdtA family cupin domain-containing protein [Muribaculaceae bacterium]|nr:FdtA/QdtA family cupin domain-containing protein [Muribaculaceae bacterium]
MSQKPQQPIDHHATSTLEDCRIIGLERHRHANGSLSVVENTDAFPFEVKRVFYLYDVPGDSSRGGHSHHMAAELIISVSGCFDVTLRDSAGEPKVFRLDRPYKALYVPPGIWRELDNFSSGSVCMVLTSELYSEEDYVRSIDEFHRLTAHKL